MLKESCHCGAVHFTFSVPVESATACNCTSCRRWGGLWVYDYENEGITLEGSTHIYRRGNTIVYHFCPVCACVTAWRALQVGEDGRRRMAVNVRLCEPETVADLLIDHFEGLHTFEDLPRDGRRVKDLWF